MLLSGADPDAILAAAEYAEWAQPGALTAVVLPESQVATALTAVDPHALHPTDDVPELPDGLALLLVPSSGSPGSRSSLLR